MAKKKTTENETRVYKCPYVDCDSFFKNYTPLKEHLKNTRHDSKDLIIKCPLRSCPKPYQCDEHTDIRNSTLAIIKLNIEKLIENIRNDINNVCISELQKERSTISLIIKSFVINGAVRVFEGEFFYCRVLGCGKKYKAFFGYEYHISHYKHSLAEVISEYSRTNKIQIDETKIKQELSDERYINGFILEDVRHYSSEERSIILQIEFKNDFYNVDKKRDKFIKRKKLKDYDTSYISKYTGEVSNNSLIHNVIYKGEHFDKKSGKMAFGLFFYNIYEFISSVYFDDQSKKIYVSTKSTITPDILFEFKAFPSRVYIFDLDLNLINTVSSNFGSPLKIRRTKENEYFVLFKDGRIRKVNIEDFSLIEELCLDQIIDFEMFDGDTVLCTDGKRLYKVKDNEVVNTSSYFPNAINCIVMRPKERNSPEDLLIHKNRTGFINEPHVRKNIKDKLYVINEDENKMLNEIREKLRTYTIYCSTVEGGIFALNDDLSDIFDVLFCFTSKLIYMPHFDVFIVTDSMNDKTKVLSIKDEFIKTHLVFDRMVHLSVSVYSTIVFAGYNASVYQTYFNYNKIKKVELIKFYRADADLLILDHSEEYAMLPSRESFDYSTLIVEVFEHDHYLFIFLASGVVVKKLLKN